MTFVFGCSSSKPQVMESTVTQTNRDTGAPIKTNGVAEEKNQSITWSSTIINKD
jgi:hypothetical protein